MRVVQAAISPCPNDTFAFYAWIHGKIPGAPEIQVVYRDIEELNELCAAGSLDLCKVSMRAYLDLVETHVLMNAGSALGFGCGPLLVCLPEATSAAVETLRIASPGKNTTAELMLRMWAPKPLDIVEMQFDRVVPAILAREVDAGLIIHEVRFTFEREGLRSMVDLGSWWEMTTRSPIPLGGVVARRALDDELVDACDRALSASIDFAQRNLDEVIPFMARYAQDMNRDVMLRHVELYVNAFTRELGVRGRGAISRMKHEAEIRGLILPRKRGLFRNASAGESLDR